MGIGIYIGNTIGKGGRSGSSYWTPQIPTGFKATVYNNGQINLSVDYTGTDEDGYSWERSDDGGATYSVIATTGNGVKTYSNTGRSIQTLYIYRVRAYKGAVYSVYSNIDAACIFITDKDGNYYHYITIGTQTFLLENLKTTKYNDDSVIPTGLSNANWALEDGSAGHDGAYADPNGDSNNKTDYGLLYNWFSANNIKGLAPPDTHIPTSTELAALMTGLGGTGVAGGKMKEMGITHWTTPNTGADNTSGFTARAAGFRDGGTGVYALFKTYSLIGAANALNATNAYRVYMANIDDDLIADSSWLKREGVTLRCIADVTVAVPTSNGRFQDTFIGNIIPSLDAYGEPSVLVSDDGEQIDLWFSGTVLGVSNIYHSYSTDGLVFSVPVKTSITDGFIRSGVFKEGSTYYIFANGSSDTTIHCFSSTDKINFTDNGEVIGRGGLGAWDQTNLGNTFVWKKDSIYYLFYDGFGSGNYWKTGIATATSITGPWTKYINNPVFYDDNRTIEGAEIFRVDGSIITHGGYYYAYMAHGVYGQMSQMREICRYKSVDLFTWVYDGLVVDPFHIETGFVSFGDASYCQYKGKSYIFMNPSNQVDSAYIDIGIDNRPLIAMLALAP